MPSVTYSQKDARWGSLKLPYSSLNLAQAGCYITAIAMLAQVDPKELLEKSSKAGGFTNGGLLRSDIVARAGGISYVGASRIQPLDRACIAKTDHYLASQGTYHFYVKLPDGRRIDPLDPNPQPEGDGYNVLEYRVFDSVKFAIKPANGQEFEDPSSYPNIPSWALPHIEWAQGKGVKTDPTKLCGDIPVYQLFGIIHKLMK